MLVTEPQQPYPDYVTCPHCGEPEVEVWCYAVAVPCHACGQTLEHVLPQGCVGHCDHTTCAIEQPHGLNKFNGAR